MKTETVRASDPDAPLECLLTREDGQRRRPAIDALFASLDRQEQTRAGTRFVFRGEPSELWPMVREFVAEESLCCPFYDFAIKERQGGVELEVSLPPQRIEIEGL